jgi:hypothetical protein
LEYLSEAIAAAAALKAAVRLGVLDQLDAEVATVQELAAACGIDEAGAERLLTPWQASASWSSTTAAGAVCKLICPDLDA